MLIGPLAAVYFGAQQKRVRLCCDPAAVRGARCRYKRIAFRPFSFVQPRALILFTSSVFPIADAFTRLRNVRSQEINFCQEWQLLQTGLQPEADMLHLGWKHYQDV